MLNLLIHIFDDFTNQRFCLMHCLKYYSLQQFVCLLVCFLMNYLENKQASIINVCSHLYETELVMMNH